MEHISCPLCKATSLTTHTFCHSCGARIQPAQGGSILHIPDEGLMQEAEQRKRTLRNERNGILAIFATIVLMIIVVGILFAPKGSNAPSAASATPAPSPMPTMRPPNQLVVVKSRWEKGGFGAVAIWRVTLKNNTSQPIGDIQYKTIYYSETGNVVDRGGVDSLLDKKMVQKVIPPGATRTIEINDGFTHSEAHRANFELIDWRFVADSR